MQMSCLMEELKHREVEPPGKAEFLNLQPSQHSQFGQNSSSSWSQLYNLQDLVQNKNDGLLVKNAG